MNILRKTVRENTELRISHRAINEKEITALKERLSTLEPGIIEKLGIDIEELTCEKVFPSLYKDRFSIEEYNKEKDAYIQKLQRIDNFREELINEAKRELGILGD